MTAQVLELAAPIAAVTVYPQGARVTRRGRVELGQGAYRIVLDNLPILLDADSVRVTGIGAFTVHGVDIDIRHGAESPDPLIAELAARRDELRVRARELADALDVEDARKSFLDGLAEHAGASFARRLAGGHPADATGFADDLAARHAELRARQRTLRTEAEQVDRELAAVQRTLAERPAQGVPDRAAVIVEVVAESAGAGEVDISYVVHGASWRSSYDVRYADDKLALTWYGLVTQHSGEDWPEVELALSTARVATTVRVPELAPWFLERLRHAPIARARAEMPAPAAKAFVADEMTLVGAAAGAAVAAVEQGQVAATYRPARGVAVPADGQAHRACVAVLELSGDLDHVVVPVISSDVYVRATVTNTSDYTLLPGRASVFNGAEFVGVTELDTWAPGAEVELALGIDDRVRAERKLKRQSAGRGFTTNRRESAFTIELVNHTPRAIELTVRDQVPVSRDEAIAVKDVRIEPRPATTSELGEITWELSLDPGHSTTLTVGFKVEMAKGVELRNWRD